MPQDPSAVHAPNRVMASSTTSGALAQRLLLTAAQAAALCGRSGRTWWTWHAAGRIPRPVRIGRSVLWRAKEIREWIDAGCPPLNEWEAARS